MAWMRLDMLWASDGTCIDIPQPAADHTANLHALALEEVELVVRPRAEALRDAGHDARTHERARHREKGRTLFSRVACFNQVLHHREIRVDPAITKRKLDLSRKAFSAFDCPGA